MSRDPYAAPPKQPLETPKRSKPGIWIVIAVLSLMAMMMSQGRPVGEMIVAIGPIFVSLVCLYYFLAPLMLLTNYWLAAHPVIREIDPVSPGTPREYSTGVHATGAALAPLGFVIRGHAFLESLSPSDDGFVGFFENRLARTVARFAILRRRQRGVTTLQEVLVFSTRYADGSEVLTTNNKALPSSPLKPGRHRAPFPEVRDPARLHALHVRVIQQLGEFSSRVDTSGPGALGYAAIYDEEMAHLAELRYVRLDEPRGVYRPTVKGAFLMVWRQLWPWSLVAKANLRREAAKAIHEEKSPFA